jgi:hypothetical protein
LLEIKGLGGDEDARKLWKKLKGYHRRSLAETGMYRFKTLFGRDLKCRTFQGQQSEAYVKAKALNIYDKSRNATKRKENNLTLPISHPLCDLTGSVVNCTTRPEANINSKDVTFNDAVFLMRVEKLVDKL